MSARRIARWLLVAGIATLGFYWYPDNWLAYKFIASLYDALSASLIAISITVLLIDNANEQRDTRQLKKRLLWEMGSSDQAFANRAAKELRDAGWLTDGSLEGVVLTLANLQRAQLDGASLKGAILTEANLSWANLEEAALQSANLENVTGERLNARKANIRGAILRGAKLPNANLEEVQGQDVVVDMLGASLIRASLRGAALKGAQLEDCDFYEADMTRIDLTSATLLRATVTGAILTEANLERSDLSELRGWTEIRSISGARITGARNAPDGFRAWAVEHGAIDGSPVRQVPQNTALPEPDDCRIDSPESSTSSSELVPTDRIKEQLKAGDHVEHDSYGLGIVKEVLGRAEDPEAKVDFGNDYGIKHLVVRYAPMDKL